MTKCSLCFLLPAILLLSLSNAWGADFEVNSTVDASDADPTDGICDDGMGFCTVRAAIEQANADDASDSVILGEATYFLTEGPLWIRSAMRVLGKGMGLSVIDGNGISGVFIIQPAQPGTRVRIHDVTITHGRMADGGGLAILTGSVAVERSAIHENVADGVTPPIFPELGSLHGIGGGIAIDYYPVVNVRETVISGNVSVVRGGGVHTEGLLSMRDSLISGNESRFGGGGMTTDGQRGVTIRDSVIEKNVANEGGGGGIEGKSPLVIRNTTIRLNESHGCGGGIDFIYSQLLVVRDSRIEDNVAASGEGGGLCFAPVGIALLPGTILSGNLPNNCTKSNYSLVWPPCASF